jgi:DNA-binding NarL/FixJ family response regulator
MKPLNVVVAQNDSLSAEALAASLQNHFRVVALARSLDEVRCAIPKHRADVAVIDLEMTSFTDIDALHREFGRVEIVCTHRLADEGLWTQALAAGASDCCHPSDVRSIVFAASRTVPMARGNAA